MRRNCTVCASGWSPTRTGAGGVVTGVGHRLGLAQRSRSLKRLGWLAHIRRKGDKAAEESDAEAIWFIGQIRQLSVTQKNSLNSQLSSITYGYDARGRMNLLLGTRHQCPNCATFLLAGQQPCRAGRCDEFHRHELRRLRPVLLPRRRTLI